VVKEKRLSKKGKCPWGKKKRKKEKRCRGLFVIPQRQSTTAPSYLRRGASGETMWRDDTRLHDNAQPRDVRASQISKQTGRSRLTRLPSESTRAWEISQPEPVPVEDRLWFASETESRVARHVFKILGLTWWRNSAMAAQPSRTERRSWLGIAVFLAVM